jgi:hypothetical protein
MRKLVPILAVMVMLLVGWQIGVVYVENDEFSSDIRELTTQDEARSGLESISTEDDLKSAVMASAQQHSVRLAPDRLTVHRTLTPGTYAANGILETPAMLEVSIAADYDAPVNLFGRTFNIHFNPSSSHSAPVILK